MKIELERIGPAGLELDRELAAEDLGIDPESLRIVAPVRFKGRLDRTTETVTFKGSIRTEVRLPCSRCAEPFSAPIEESFRAVYLLQPEPSDEERDLEPEELDVSHLTEDRLDITEAIREQILLAVPLKPICDPQCSGVCAQCGANKNENPCDCQPPVDPRLAKLEALIRTGEQEEE